MIAKRTLYLLAICMTVGLFTLLGPTRTVSGQDTKPQTISITGCVQKGEGENQYFLTGDENKKYALTAGSNIALDSHVGKKVTVTGTAGAGEPPAGYAGQLSVTGVKVVEKGECP